MEQKNGREKKAGLSEEQRQYLTRRFLVEFLLFAIILAFAAVQSFSASELGLTVLLAAAAAGVEVFCERNVLRHYDVNLPKPDLRIMWKKDGMLFFGIWIFFAVVFYFLRGKPPLSAGLIVWTVLGSGFAACTALYLRCTRMKCG